MSALDNVNGDLGLLNLLGNVVMFAPIGFLLPVATRLRGRGAVISCATLSLAVECAQLVLGRTFDIDDILLNSFGGFCGAAVGAALAGVLQRRFSRDREPTLSQLSRER
jgi:glycopeptide antibiotics resistance protein